MPLIKLRSLHDMVRACRYLWEPDRYLYWDGNQHWGLEKKWDHMGVFCCCCCRRCCCSCFCCFGFFFFCFFQESALHGSLAANDCHAKSQTFVYNFSDFLGRARNLDEYMKSSVYIMLARRPSLLSLHGHAYQTKPNYSSRSA